jgi:hypothetical protein
VSVSLGSDGEGVEVVGEDRLSGSDPHPVMSLQARAAHPVAALEVTDSSFDPDAVSGAAFLGATGGGLMLVGEVDSLVARSGSASLVGAGRKPPSATISRGRILARCSSAAVCGGSVFSAGFPGAWPAGRMNSRAPRRVFSVTSQICATYPNSVGLPSLPLRIGRASGSAIDTAGR